MLFLGRETSCINSGGEKIYVEEVERVVKSHPAIYDALVVGLPNERWGQQVTAVVSLAPGQRGSGARRAARALQAASSPTTRSRARWSTAPEIVRSPSGKPDYEWAKRHASEGERGPA